MYESVLMIDTYMQWVIAIATAILTLRVIYIVFDNAYSFENNANAGIGEKIKKHIVAIVICVIVEAFISTVKKYFFGTYI